MDTEALATAWPHRHLKVHMLAGDECPVPSAATWLFLSKTLALALAVLLTALGCSRQEGVTLSGVVQDPSGSRVPHAHLRMTDLGRGMTVATTAGADGSFRIDGLAPSPSYRIEVHGPIQFESHVQDLDLTADRQLEVSLGIKPIAEAIVVSGAPPEPEPSQPGKPRTRVRVGGNVRKARLVQYASPIYPADAQREGVAGTVLMEAVIGTEGRLVGLSRLNSMVDERLAAAASEAVIRWKYQPTLLNGRPAEVAVTVSVAFELP